MYIRVIFKVKLCIRNKKGFSELKSLSCLSPYRFKTRKLSLVSTGNFAFYIDVFDVWFSSVALIYIKLVNAFN